MKPNSFVPNEAVIKSIKTETSDVNTYTIALTDPEKQKSCCYEAGQYNMVSLPGIGEAPLSISSSRGHRDDFDHTVRIVGRLTTAWSKLGVGGILGIRGPYGRPWPVEILEDKHVVVISGGTGIACVKPAINHVVDFRDNFKSVTILYGAKSTPELVFADQFEEWQNKGAQVHLTVDNGQPLDWPFHVGVVTTLFNRIKSPPKDTIVFISGPEIMMRFCVVDLIKRGFSHNQIYVSMERRMDCAVRMCGHCQIGPKYVCQDGPVFSYEEIQDLFGVVA